MLVPAYLHRINDTGPLHPAAGTLRRIHRAHLLAVPFENLDIHLGRPIVLSVPAFYRKIVGDRRGGFCYELNGAFAWLLTELGFRVSLLSARVFSEGGLSEAFDHMALLVEDDGPWLADVGFGDSFLEPLRIETGAESTQQGWSYGLVREGRDWILRRRRGSEAWEPRFRFSLRPRRLEEFAGRCHFQQTSPESHFTQKPVCSLATEEGRITLSGCRLIRTQAEHRDVHDVQDPEEYRTILARHFGTDIQGPDVNRLMAASPRD